MPGRAFFLACAVAVLLGAGSRERIQRVLLDGDYAQAAPLLEEYLDQAPHDAVMLYNAACVWSRLGEHDRAASYLRRAVAEGMTDLEQILGDRDLEPIREHPTYRAVVEPLRSRRGPHRGNALQQWRATYGDDNYRYQHDQERHIDYATALDPLSQQETQRMIERQWDQLRTALFDGALPEPPVLIAVPAPSDAARLFADDRTGGIYEHEKRRLIARDTGTSLRHELVHALHYAHMEKLRQRHPLWVQEGLASLYESYVISGDGAIEFLPNERQNVARGLAKAGRLTHWDDLLNMSSAEFMDDASRLYPQVRSIFEFLADRRMLACWYQSLQQGFDSDRTGRTAFTTCFGQPLEQVEREWKRRLLARAPVDMQVEAGDAALGIESRPHASNDGVLITRVLPGSAAARGELKAGDVIVAVDDRPTRTLPELQAVIASRAVGDNVAVRARRDRDYFTVVLALRPLQPMAR